MAAAIKALNAKIRANPVADYLCSTHFWGPASNFGIPIAAVMDTQKDPEFISGTMTAALIGYSATFMRYAFAVRPANYLLFGCHAVNFSAQTTQAYRYLNYYKFGGKEAKLADQAKALGQTEAANVAELAKKEVTVVSDKAKELGSEAKKAVNKVTG